MERSEREGSTNQPPTDGTWTQSAANVFESKTEPDESAKYGTTSRPRRACRTQARKGRRRAATGSPTSTRRVVQLQSERTQNSPWTLSSFGKFSRWEKLHANFGKAENKQLQHRWRLPHETMCNMALFFIQFDVESMAMARLMARRTDLPNWWLAGKAQTTNWTFWKTNDVSTQVLPTSIPAAPVGDCLQPPSATAVTYQLHCPDTNRLVLLENSYRHVRSGSVAGCRGESGCARDLTGALPAILALTSSPLVSKKLTDEQFVSRQQVVSGPSNTRGHGKEKELVEQTLLGKSGQYPRLSAGPQSPGSGRAWDQLVLDAKPKERRVRLKADLGKNRQKARK